MLFFKGKKLKYTFNEESFSMKANIYDKKTSSIKIVYFNANQRQLRNVFGMINSNDAAKLSN